MCMKVFAGITGEYTRITTDPTIEVHSALDQEWCYQQGYKLQQSGNELQMCLTAGILLSWSHSACQRKNK